MITVLCIPLSSMGHINACVAICLSVKRKGHKVIFAIEESWKGQVVKYGLEEVLYSERDTNNNEESGQFWIENVNEIKPYFRLSDKDKFHSRGVSFPKFVNAVKYSNDQVHDIITSICPDVIIQDNYIAYPSIVNSKIPYVLLNSANPLQSCESEELPPGCFGLPLNDKSEWSKCREIKKQCLFNLWNDYSEWMTQKSAPPLKPCGFQYISPYLNVHLYPRALYEEYAKRANLGTNYMLIEHRIRESDEPFELPETFADKPGKVIYLSLGSMASSDVELMKRLIDILSKCKHKVIVSKGSKHRDYELGDNMWGAAMLPQLKVLKMCDLFITHGGNNSFTEAMYFGKPMIAMPLFADQTDNAKRLEETNLGIRVNPFTVTEEELLSAIDSMIENKELNRRLNAIAKEVQKSDGLEKVSRRIEELSENLIALDCK